MADHKILRYGAGGTWVTVLDEGLYVAKTGSTMTGNLTIPNGTLTGHAVNKGQLDAVDALKVAKAGDTMTGTLTSTASIPILQSSTSGDLAAIRSTLGSLGSTAIQTHVFPDSPLFLPAEANGLWLASAYLTPTVLESSPDNTVWTALDPLTAKRLLAQSSTNLTQNTKYLRITVDLGGAYYPCLVVLRGVVGTTGLQGRILSVQKLTAADALIGTALGPTPTVLVQEGPIIAQAFNAYDGTMRKLRVTIELTNWAAGNTAQWRALNVYTGRSSNHSFQSQFPFAWDENKGVSFQTNAAAATPLIVKGVASQTADLMTLENSAGTDLAWFTNVGKLVAPAVQFGSITGPDIASSTSQYGGVRVTSPADSVMEIKATGGRAYYSWYGGTDGNRRGYLGYANTTTNESILNAEGGRMWVQGAGILLASSGTFDLQAASNNIYHNAGSHIFRNGAGTTDWAHIDALGGNGGILFTQGGGGWYMSDTTWVRSYSNKGVYTAGVMRADAGFQRAGDGYMITHDTDTDSGLYHWGDGVVGLVGNGSGVIRTSTMPNLQIGHQGVAVSGDPYTTFFCTGGGPTTFGTQPIILRNHNAGNVGVSFWVNQVAPILKAWTGAEALEVRNGGDTLFVPIKASAFTVNSTVRSKMDIVEVSDTVLLDRARKARSIKFRSKGRPQTVNPSPRFIELNTRWQERGRSPLQPVHFRRDFVLEDHVCGLGNCEGTEEDPCSMTLNDTEMIGLSAEDVYEYFPEAVDLDGEGLPAGIDVAQVATASFAAVGALIRKIEALEARLAELEVA